MFNRNKLIKLSNELSEKGYATSPDYVAGCFWFDVPIGSRKNIFLKILNTGRYLRKPVFLTIANNKIYCFPFKRKEPHYDSPWELNPEMIVNKDKLPLNNLDMKIQIKDGIVAKMYPVVGTFITEEFVKEFLRILKT